MIWSICFYTACVIFALAAVGAAAAAGRGREHDRVITPTNILAAGVFLSSTAMFVPIYSEYFSGDGARAFKTALLSLHNAIRLFVVDSDFDVIKSAAADKNTAFARGYSVLAAILYVLAPVLTFGFVLSFFKNVSSYRRLVFGRNRKMYVFSALNDKSLAMAENLRAGDNKALIVFTGVFDEDSGEASELKRDADRLRAICFRKDILSVNFRLHSREKEMFFFAMNDDEAENVRDGLGLIEEYSSRPHTKLYVFAAGADSEAVFASKASEEMNMRFHRVNDVRALIERELYDNGARLFEEAKPDASGEKVISAVVVGAGRYGREMIKVLSWLCQMDGYRVEINAFDLDPLAESRFAAQCPELMDDAHNGRYCDGEAKYSISIRSGVDVTTKEFIDELKKLENATYAFVALGSDEMNIRESIALRTQFERMHIHPRIQSVVFDSEKCEALKNLCNYSGQPYDIDFIGDRRSFYTDRVIINSGLEQQALSRHLEWGDERSFWAYEYNYRSSVASAMHMKMRIACGIPGADKPEVELTEEETVAIAKLEHSRWNAYMRSEGYVFTGDYDKKSRNNLGKMHHDLVPFRRLDEDEIKKDINVGTV